MDDLRIPPGPGCPRGLRVPAAELIERFSHASGPGGQGVNTSDSRVQLGLDLATTTALDEQQRERALAHLGERLTGTVLTVAAAEHRSQRRTVREIGLVSPTVAGSQVLITGESLRHLSHQAR